MMFQVWSSKYDPVQDLMQDLKVFLGKILESSCKELIKTLAGFFQDVEGIYIQDNGKTLIRSYRISSIFLWKFVSWQYSWKFIPRTY